MARTTATHITRVRQTLRLPFLSLSTSPNQKALPKLHTWKYFVPHSGASFYASHQLPPYMRCSNTSMHHRDLKTAIVNTSPPTSSSLAYGCRQQNSGISQSKPHQGVSLPKPRNDCAVSQVLGQENAITDTANDGLCTPPAHQNIPTQTREEQNGNTDKSSS